MRPRSDDAGQASVELVALLPLVVAVILAAGQALAAGAASELASHASEAGAVAVLQERDPVRAARAAVPGWSRARLAVRAEGRRVAVRMRPVTVFPGLAKLLVADSVSYAGPLP